MKLRSSQKNVSNCACDQTCCPPLSVVRGRFRLGNGATVPERLMALIWPQKFVRLKLQVVTRFPRHVWIPQKFALKLRDVQKK